MLELANDLTAQGLFVVLDVTFAQKAFQSELIQLGKKYKHYFEFCSMQRS